MITSDIKRGGWIAIVLLLALFLAANVLATMGLSRARLDLTQGRLYTLTSGSREIVKDINEPIRLTLFYSGSRVSGRPDVQSYGRRVKEVLDAYRVNSGGMVIVEHVDPEPFSEAEDRAQREGVPAIPLGPGEQMFFGLVGVNSTEGREAIPYFDPRQEEYLEYEISRLIYKLAHPEKPKVGIITSLPLDGDAFVPGRPPTSRPWEIMREIRALYEAEVLMGEQDTIPEDVDLLLVVHPKQIPEATVRAIDKYVTSGKPAIVYVDPLCEGDVPPEAQSNPLAVLNANRTSSLEPALASWGVVFDTDQVIADMKLAIRQPTPDRRDVAPYVQYLNVTQEQCSKDDPATKGLSSLIFVSSGWIHKADGATTTLTPLVTTSPETMLVTVETVKFFPDPKQLIGSFASTGEVRTLAARVTGKAKSAFGEQSGNINIVVIADADPLSDNLWIRPVRFGDQVLGYQKVSDNGALLMNLLDQMTGSSALVSIRARGGFQRPFTLVNEIREQAEKKYLTEADRLEQERRDTQRKLDEMQRAKGENTMILSPEQEAEINQFQDKLAQTRAQLRSVQYNLSKDVDSLGLRVRLINTIGAPAVVAAFAIGLSVFRVARRKADRKSMAGQG